MPRCLLLGLTVCLAVACAHGDPRAAEGAPAAAVPPPALVITTDPNGPPPAILIMPLHSEPTMAATAHTLDEMILDAVAQDKRLQALGPEDINALLGVEKMKDAVGCDDAACAAQLGGALGAPYLIAGQLSLLGDEAVLSLRLMDTRDAKLVSRGGARGPRDADGLSQIVVDTLGELLGIRVASLKRVINAKTGSQGMTADYAAYQKMVSELGRMLGQMNYTGLLQAIDAYERQPPPAVAGQDSLELLTYYRITACTLLKRPTCVETVAQKYLERWPEGTYAQAVRGFVAQLETLRAQKASRDGALQQKLADIDAKERGGKLSHVQALELAAGAAMGAVAYPRAAQLYGELIGLAGGDDGRYFKFVSLRATAFELAGAYDDARRLLEEARRRNAAMFAAEGLNQTLLRLPK